jgi:quinohemoprotein amine dehydrogenase
MRAIWAAGAVWMAASAYALGAQPPAPPPSQPAAPVDQSAAPVRKPEDGLPIVSEVVRKACAPCHTTDERQQMSRISFQRNTPEGWQQVIRRMAALNGLRIDPATAREVVRYLSNQHGLAPDEVRAAAWDLERRWLDFKYPANTDTERTCSACHSLGRVIAQRRTRDEWNLLIAMHRGFYPLVDNQGFRRPGPPPREPSPDGRPPDTRHPVERAVDHLARTFPLKTAEWTAWSATMRPPRLDGAWLLSGTELGKGPFYGRMIVRGVPSAPDEFTTEITYTYAVTGERVTRSGRTIVYTGFQWRGRSDIAGNDDSTLQEVMFVDRDWRSMEGRWFTGGYDELGVDVRLDRVGGETRILGTSRPALRAGASAQQIKIYGANFPGSLQTGEVDLGPGVTVTSVMSVTPEEATVVVDVAPQAAIGYRDVFVAGASRQRGLVVYDSIDALKVLPEWGMARVGGVTFPKGLAQFEAHAFDHGADNRPDTPDDLDLGIVPATWSLEEFAATYDDDDVKFVGAIDAKTGLFTPNVDGPNTARKGSRNNVGDVYAVATYTPAEADAKTRTLRARSHLLVTVPLYMRWEAPRSGTR